MNNLTFKYEGLSQVRTVTIDSEPWFVLADVCTILGVVNSRLVAKRLDDDEKGVYNIYTLGGKQEVTIVSESGLYHVILTSRSEKAKPFRRWVTHEVLPAIRKQGYYSSLSDEDLVKCIAQKQAENRHFLQNLQLKRNEKQALIKLEIDERMQELWAKRWEMDYRDLEWEMVHITGDDSASYKRWYRKFEEFKTLQDTRRAMKLYTKYYC